MNFNKLCIHADRGRQFELGSGKNLYLQNYRMNVSIQVSPPKDKKVKKPVIVLFCKNSDSLPISEMRGLFTSGRGRGGNP